MNLFVRDLGANRTDVFAQNWVVVPNHACRNWVEREVAKQLGICSQLRFIQPGSLVWEITQLADIDISEHFRPQHMLWHVVDQKDVDLSVYQHAKRTTACLNNYMRERPEWVLEWEQGRSQHPHAHVWRNLIKDIGEHHLVHALNALDVSQLNGPLPASLQVFLPEQISPLVLRFIERIAERVEVHMYVVNPIPDDYWFKIATSREMAQQAVREINDQTAYDSPYYTTLDIGHPLLANLGRQKANLLDYLLEQDQIDFVETEPEYDSSQSTLLADVREDIGLQRLQPNVVKTDSSIQIHACHNRKRELEVIKDKILQQLKQDTTLQPYDVLVVAPDINDYAAAIEEVFVREPALHYHIDRLQLADRETVRALLAIVASFEGNMEQQSIANLLDYTCVRSHFGIADEDIAVIQRWLQESHVLWGYDASHRQRVQADAVDSNTWSQAKRRWLQGYLKGTYEPEDAYLEVFGDHDGLETVFAAMFDLMDLWYGFRVQADSNMGLSQWYQWLSQVQKSFLGEMDSALLRRLSEQFLLTADVDPVINFTVMQQLVSEAIAEQNYRSVGRIGVRFQSWENACHAGCRVLAVMGMNHGEFPHQERKDALDLTAYYPHPLSKNVNLRDKNLLLNALIEPLDQLIVSYQGFSPQDNSPLEPSSVIQQLIEYLQQKTEGAFSVRTHRMHGFSPEYFNIESDASFSRYQYQRLSGVQEKWMLPLQQEPSEPVVQNPIELEDFKRFMADPLTFYIKNVIEIDGAVQTDASDDYESYQPQPLEQWHINQLILKHPQDQQILHKSESIPQDATGEVVSQIYLDQRAHQLQRAEQLQSHRLSVTVHGCEITGRVKTNDALELTTVLLSRLNAKDVIRHWCQHMLWQQQSGQTRSYLYALDRQLSFSTGNTTELLLPWLTAYHRVHETPCCFVPQFGFKLNKQLQLCTEAEYKKKLVVQPVYAGQGLDYLLQQCLDYPEIETEIEALLLPLTQSSEAI